MSGRAFKVSQRKANTIRMLFRNGKTIKGLARRFGYQKCLIKRILKNQVSPCFELRSVIFKKQYKRLADKNHKDSLEKWKKLSLEQREQIRVLDEFRRLVLQEFSVDKVTQYFGVYNMTMHRLLKRGINPPPRKKEVDVEKLREAYSLCLWMKEMLSQEGIGKMFGVTKKTVSWIVNYRSPYDDKEDKQDKYEENAVPAS